jgi:EAL and modified HD-GYP domain-containing signal transduction protein
MDNSVTCATPATVYLARQPIYNTKREICAYELLYRRNSNDTTAEFPDADQASADVMLKAFLEIGLLAVSPDRPVFINHTRRLLSMDPLLPPDRCVVEVLEDVAAEPDTVCALQRLKGMKYRIALDDFVFDPERIPMIQLADYIKLDLRALGEKGFQEQLRLLQPFKVTIVAEKIETETEFRFCRKVGSRLFQGYYLRRPETVRGRRIPANRLSVLSVLSECSDMESSSGVVAGLISRDPALTYGLLRLANSALYRRRSEIRTATQAVNMLGMDFIYRWACLLALSDSDDCPTGYLETAIQRARMCELVAANFHCVPQEAYITGLLSTLDSVFNAQIDELVEPLPIDIRFKRALLAREGPLGKLLNAAIAYETGDWIEGDGVVAEVMQKAFWGAAEYARGMIGQMSRFKH